MAGKSRGSRKGLAVLLAVLAVFALVPGTVGADHRPLITCDASGLVEFTANPPGPSASPWSILGVGSCQGDGHGTYKVEFTGTGTSDTLGRCGGTDLVQNLELKVTVTLTSFQDMIPQVKTERWAAPLTTFPVVSPFQIHDGGDLVGGGVFFTRIAGNCPPEGQPVAKFFWSRTV